jgi:hypothetical protein
VPDEPVAFLEGTEGIRLECHHFHRPFLVSDS